MDDPLPLNSSSTRTHSGFATRYLVLGIVLLVSPAVILFVLGWISLLPLLTWLVTGIAFLALSARLLFVLSLQEHRSTSQNSILLRSVANHASGALFLKDQNGKIVLMNEAAQRSNPNADTSLSEQSQVDSLQVTSTLVHDDAGDVIGIIETISDLAEPAHGQVAPHEIEQRFHEIADAVPALIWVSDTTQNCVWFNRRWIEFVGKPLETQVGNGWLDSVHPDDREVTFRKYLSAFNSRTAFVIEYRMRRNDGQYRWMLDSGGPRTTDGEFSGYIGTCVDITERMQAEDALRASESRLAEAQRVARLGSWTWDPTSNQVWWSDAIYELFDLDPKSVTPSFEAFLDCLHPEDRAKGLVRAKAMIAGGDQFADDLRIVRRDGSCLWLHSRAQVNRDHVGRITRIEGTDQDISERKKIEESLRSSEERLRLAQAILDAVGDSILVTEAEPIDLPGPRILYANPAFLRSTGYSLAEVIGQTPRILQGEKTNRAALDRIRASLKKWKPIREEMLNYRKDKSEFWVELEITPLADQTGWFTHWISVQRDVTDRKRAEEALRASEERLRLALAVGGLGTWDLDLRTGQAVWSDDHYAMHGYEPGSVPPSYQAWLDRIHPDDRRVTESALTTARDARTPFIFDFRALLPDGSIRWLSARGRYFYDDEGHPIRMVGVGRDVTSQLEGERTRRLAEFSVERAVEAIFWIAPSGVIQYANTAAHRLLGYVPGELVGKTVSDIDPNFPADYWATHWNEVKSRGSFTFESRHLTKQGISLLTEVTVNYIQHEDRDYNCAVMRDLTERKRVETAARESESRLAAFMEHTPTLAWVNDELGRNHLVNAAWVRAFGNSVDQINGQDLESFLPRQSVSQYRESDRAVLDMGSVVTTVESGPREGGGTGTYLVTKFPLGLSPEGHRLVGGVAIDITDRAAAETALRSSEERLRLALLAGRMGTFDWDVGYDRVVWSDTHYELWGYQANERPKVSYRTFLERIHPSDQEDVETRIIRSRDNRTLLQHEYRVVLPDGEVRWISSRGEFQYSEDGKPLRMLGTVQDVTDRKVAELSLLESERRYRDLADAIPHIVWTADRDGGLTHLNVMAEQYTGRPIADLTHWQWKDIVHPDDLSELLLTWAEVVRTGIPKPFDFRIRRADGTYRWHIFRQTPAFDSSGDRNGWYATCTDVDDLKVAEAALRSSEEQLILAIRATGVVIWDLDIVADTHVWRTEGDDRFGWREPQEHPQPTSWWIDRVHSDDVERVTSAFYAAVADPTIRTYRDEYRFLCSNGDYADVLDYGYMLRDDHGQAIRVVGAMFDLTDRKRADRVIRESEERLRLALTAATAIGFVWDAVTDSVVRYFSTISSLPVNLEAPEPVAAVRARVHPDDVALFDEGVDSCLRQGSEYRNLYRVITLDGSVRWLEEWGTLDRHPDGRPLRLTGISIDVTDRKRSEEALRESEERYRRLVQVLPTAVLVHDGEKITFCNAAFVKLVGAESADQVIGSPHLQFVQAEFIDIVKSRFESMQMSGEPGIGLEMRFIRLDGRPVPAYTVGTPIRYGERTAYLVAVSDLSERERAAELLKSVMGSVSDAIVTIDTTGMITSVSPATQYLFGYADTELLGHNVNILMPTTERNQHDRYITNYLMTGIAKVIGTGREVDAMKKDGSTFPVELTVTEFQLNGERRFTGVIRDISARRRLEEQLRQSQKMEAIGRLAGGVAHDFNNVLTVIIGYADILLSNLNAGSSERSAVAAIRDAGERAAALTAQLLAFSRKTIVSLKVFDLRDLVIQAERLLRRLIGEDITLSVISHAAPCRVRLDPAQIDQVIMNLAINARDAMPTGGRLTLDTCLRTVHESQGPSGPLPGRYVELTVSDTGSGMTDEVLAKIFEPFFTTKEVGKGTGLGLATVYGIVQQAGGHISVTSRLGVGTTFRVLFPAVDIGISPFEQEASKGKGRGSETVLLVEDDEAVRGLLTLALESQGYKVISAPSGRRALDLLRTHPSLTRLMVTDVVMPEMSGRELADQATSLIPDLKVLFVSGYTDDAIIRHGVRDAADHFLQKPFSPLTLARKVREILDNST